MLNSAALGLPRAPDELAALPPTVDEAEVEQARKYLDGLAASLTARGVTVDTIVETAPSVARAILDVATGCSADLVALGTHARGRVGRALLGSIADKVVRSAPMSVLVCPPQA
jgi:nucleotide-binding universal stress UspA family protein